MAARVIYFGCDDCYRVPVLRNAGYEVHQLESLDELSIDLQQNQVDAVIVSEDDGQAAGRAITLAREQTTAPLILFRRSAGELDENRLCDQVYWPGVRAEDWLSQTADLIALCRESRKQSLAIQAQSQQLRREAQSVREESRRQRERAHVESVQRPQRPQHRE